MAPVRRAQRWAIEESLNRSGAATGSRAIEPQPPEGLVCTLRVPLNNHCVGSLECGFGNPLGYFSAATCLPVRQIEGDFNKLAFVTFNLLSILANRLRKSSDDTKAPQSGRTMLVLWD